MSDPFLGQIKMFAGNFAPVGWARCDGQLLPISANAALFSLLGTTYGGDGRTTFGLPDLRARSPIFAGFGSPEGLRLGDRGGEEQHTLTTAEIPSHTHTIAASNAPASLGEATNAYWAASPAENAYGTVADPVIVPAPEALAGGTATPHENRQPYLAVTMIIALVGVFPSRT